MKIRKIHIVGIYATGKSTLARKLARKLKIKAYELEDIKYIRKYDKVRSVKDRLKIVKQISRGKQWITEGPWLDYAKDLYKEADLVIFLQLPKKTLYKRILIRHFKRKFHRYKYKEHNLKSMLKHMKIVNQYFHDPKYFLTLKSHKDYMKKHAKKVITIKNNKDVRKLLKELK